MAMAFGLTGGRGGRAGDGGWGLAGGLGGLKPYPYRLLGRGFASVFTLHRTRSFSPLSRWTGGRLKLEGPFGTCNVLIKLHLDEAQSPSPIHQIFPLHAAELARHKGERIAIKCWRGPFKMKNLPPQWKGQRERERERSQRERDSTRYPTCLQHPIQCRWSYSRHACLAPRLRHWHSVLRVHAGITFQESQSARPWHRHRRGWRSVSAHM